MITQTIAFTGHRPQKIGGFGPNPTARWVDTTVRAAIARAQERGFNRFIAGGALGFDTIAAVAVLDAGLHLTLALPFAGQDVKWAVESRREYAAIIERTRQQRGEVVFVSGPGYAGWKMTARDHWMVDRASHVIACWDGALDGGTWRTVEYSKSLSRPIFHMNPATRTAHWI